MIVKKIEYTIDFLYMLKALLKKSWIIILSVVLAGFISFCYYSYFKVPTYSSYIKLYVNNSTTSINNNAISSGDLVAAQSLVRTYGDILDSRTTLERVINRANLNYSWKKLSKMINTTSSNNTEVMQVTVTSKDPYEASRIANTIAQILPERISEIIEGSSMKVVDSAVPNKTRTGPTLFYYVEYGMFTGFLLSTLFLIAVFLLDDKIYDEKYVLEKYDFPLLGKVPNLMISNQ